MNKKSNNTKPRCGDPIQITYNSAYGYTWLFDNTNYIETVKEFHNYFGHPVLNEPTIIDKKRADLRIDLIQEEVKELQEAIKNNDLVEIADALCDIQYVLSGAILEFGMKDKFNTMFNEVHRSNMSKACTSLEEAQQTVEHYKVNKGTDSHITEMTVDDITIYKVIRTLDGKQLKSINYSPANLKTILNNE